MNYLKKYLQEVAIYLGVVLVGLIIFNGWHPGKTLGSYDLLSGHIMSIARFIANGGGSNSVYDFYISGGAEIFPITGILPIQELGLLISSSPFFIINLTVLTLLLLNGLVMRSLLLEGFKFIYGVELKINIYLELLLGFALIFMPNLGWRINHGHLNIINGVAAYALCVMVPLKIYNENFSDRSFALVAISLAHVLPYASFQMVAYALFFASPITAYLTFKIIQGKKFSKIIPALGSLLTGVLISSPIMYIMFDHFLSGSAERGVSEKKIFTYLKPSFDYLKSSLTIARDAIPTKYPPFSHHEINYPMTYSLLVGLLAAIFYSLKNKKYLIIPVLITNIIILMFCFDIFGFATSLTNAIKIMGAFRVPYRALIYFYINVLVAVLLFVLKGLEEINVKEVIGILILAAISLLIPSSIFEILALVILIGAFFAEKNMKLLKAAPVALGLIVILSLKGFSERAVDYEDIDQLKSGINGFTQNGTIGGEKLYKTLNYTGISKIGGNGLLLNNVSVINSYWHPNSNYNHAYSEIFGQPYDSSRLSFKINYQDPYYATFQSMYAVRNMLYQSKENPSAVQMIKKEGLRNIWTPSQVTEMTDMKSILGAIRSRGGELISHFDQIVYAESGSEIKSLGISKCQNAELAGISKGELNINVTTTNKCPIVLPINFSRYLKAFDQNGNILQVFRANGSLAGIITENSSTQLTLKGESNQPVFLMILKLLSYLGIIGYFIFENRVFFDKDPK